MAQSRAQDRFGAPAAVGVGWRTFQLLGFLTAISWLLSYALFLDGYTAVFVVFGTDTLLFLAGGIAYFLSPVISVVLIAIAVWPSALSVLNGDDATALAARSILYVVPVLWMTVVFVGGSAMIHELLRDPMGPTLALPIAGGAFFHVVFQHWFQSLTSIALALAPGKFRTLTDADEPAGTGAVVREMTAQMELERRLAALEEATREMTAANGRHEVAEIAARAADDVLGIQYSRVHLRDEETGELVPAAWTDETARALDGEPPAIDPDSGLVWEAFRTGEGKYYHDFDGLQGVEAADDADTPLESTLLLPLEDHGIILVQSTGPGAFTDEKIELAHTLSAITEAALTHNETERARTESARDLELAQCLLDESSESVFVVDPDTLQVLDANEPACRQHGYDLEELIAATLEDLVAGVTGDSDDDLDAVLDEALARGRLTLEGEHRRRDGTTFPVQLTFRYVDVDAGYLLVLARDRTEESERQWELAAQRTELELLGFVQRLVDELLQQVVGPSSRADLEFRTCDRLTDSPFYLDAWLVDPGQGGQSPVATAGSTDGGKVRSVDEMPPHSPMTDAVRETIDTGDAHFACRETGPATTPGPGTEDHAATPRDGAVIALPLTYDGANYGALVVIADSTARPAPFGDREQAALETLAVALAFAIHARSQGELQAGQGVELEFQATDSAAVVSALAAALDRPLQLKGLVPGSHESTIHYYAAATDRSAEEVRDLVTGIDAIDDCRVLRDESEGECVFEVRLHAPDVLDRIVAAGGVIDGATASPDDIHLVVSLLPDVDAREIEALVRDAGGDWTVTVQGAVDRPIRRVRDARETIADALTDKQREALLTAYFAGYYDYPRASEAQEIADILAIANSTLYQHLQVAQRKLIESWFDAGR